MDANDENDPIMEDVEEEEERLLAAYADNNSQLLLPAHASSSDSKNLEENFKAIAASPFQSHVPKIWDAFFQQMERIDLMEKRIEEHISRKRRRIQNILEQMPSFRRSTVRMFVTHQFDKYSGMWTLVVEGILLIGNLDHVSAAQVEKEGVLSTRGNETTNEADKESKGDISSKTNTLGASLTPDRNQYKIGAEEEDPVEPIIFTRLFDKVEVTFRTIYQPRTAATASYDLSGGLSPVKKSRSAKRKVVQTEPVAEVDSADLRASAPTKLVWNKNATAAAASAPATADAHAFWFQYNNHFSERPPPPNMKFHSIAAEIKLFPTRPHVLPQYEHDVNSEPLYQIVNENFRDKIFGEKYGVPNAKPKTENTDANKQDTNEHPALPPSIPSAVSIEGGGDGSSDYTIPLDNDIQVPLFLSYNEIVMALFQYIQDHKLHDIADKSLIRCDKLLTELFGMEIINFGYVRPLLFEKGLIKPVVRSNASQQHQSVVYGMAQRPGTLDPVAPVCLTYIMNEKSTSPQVPTGYKEELISPNVASAPGRRPMPGGAIGDASDDPLHSPSVLSFDMDVAIPALFNHRTRDLLLNVKKREFEYTTCRTKARYTLVACKGSEDAIKNKIEQSISGQGFIPENIPVFLALARAAHPLSEARSAAQIDARSCDLVGRVEESNRKALAAWEAVQTILRALGANESDAEYDQSDSEDDGIVEK
jgi:SWIB/MDM2 domain